MNIRTTIRLVTVAMFAAAAMPTLAQPDGHTLWYRDVRSALRMAKEKGYFKEGGLDVTGFSRRAAAPHSQRHGFRNSIR